MHGSDVDPARAASLPSTRGALARSAALALGLGPAVCVAVLACGASREGPASETSPPADTTTASDGAPAGDSRPGDTPAQDVAVAETSPPSECAGDPFSEAFMRRVIETLAQPAWEGRRFDSVGLRQAVSWVRDQLACLGLTPGAPSLPGLPATDFLQPFETDGDEIEPGDISDYTFDPDATYAFTNVVASIPGTGPLADEVIVLGAHLDHLGHYGGQGGALVLGANDDASGVLALLAIARQIALAPAPAARRTLVFAVWGVEEDPFYLRGSQAFAAAIDAADPTGTDRIMGYVNFDMIGSYRDHAALYLLGTYDAPEGTGLAESPGHRVARSLAADHPDLNVELGYRGEASDHVTFCEAGIPYVFFWTEDDCYHRPCDTPDRIDYPNLGRILRLAADLTEALAVDADLATARAEFHDAFLAAYPGMTCATLE